MIANTCYFIADFTGALFLATKNNFNELCCECNVMLCTVLCYIVMYCIILACIVLNRIVLCWL